MINGKLKLKTNSNKLYPSSQKAYSEVVKEEAKNRTDQINKILDFFLSFSKNKLKTKSKEANTPATIE